MTGFGSVLVFSDEDHRKHVPVKILGNFPLGARSNSTQERPCSTVTGKEYGMEEPGCLCCLWYPAKLEDHRYGCRIREFLWGFLGDGG